MWSGAGHQPDVGGTFGEADGDFACGDGPAGLLVGDASVEVLDSKGLSDGVTGGGVEVLAVETGVAVAARGVIERPAIGRPIGAVFGLLFGDFDPGALGDGGWLVERRDGDDGAIRLGACGEADPVGFLLACSFRGEAPKEQVVGGVLEDWGSLVGGEVERV